MEPDGGAGLPVLTPKRKPRGRRPKPPASIEACEAAQYLYDAIKSHSPTFMAKVQPSAIAKKLGGWARAIDVGMRNDGMDLDGCKVAIDAAHRSADPFWRSNLLGGAALRKHYEKMLLRSKGRQQPPGEVPRKPIPYAALAASLED